MDQGDTTMTQHRPDAAGAELAGRKVLIIVENLPVPFDRRVWQEATTLQRAGATVSVICPTGKGYDKRYEQISGVHIYRHPLPPEGNGAIGYALEYSAALFWQTVLSWTILFRHGFDVIQGCNPPDLVFLIAWPFKLMGKRYIFDHHDINPELYIAKFNRQDFFWRLMLLLERWNFASADVVISTNDSYRHIAHTRGRKHADDTFVVRSGPDLSRLRLVPPVPLRKRGHRYLVGYVGVMGEQEGIDLLLEAAEHIVFAMGRSDVAFCLVGGGPSLAALKQLAHDKGLDPHVEFVGRAPDDVLFEVLSTADVCVNPDRVNPMNDLSTMNKVLEYMAFGKAQVQFEVREGRHSAGEAAVYAKCNDPVDFAEKILALLADPDRCAQMGRIGRQRIENELSWEHQRAPLMAAYQRALRIA